MKVLTDLKIGHFIERIIGYACTKSNLQPSNRMYQFYEIFDKMCRREIEF